jgi:hypothetical protein
MGKVRKVNVYKHCISYWVHSSRFDASDNELYFREENLILAKYDAKTAEALEEAIRIYAHRAAGIKDDSECPLCKTFNACRGCPVWQFTNQTQCTDTPYWEWKKNPTPENAQKELDFLIGLRDY